MRYLIHIGMPQAGSTFLQDVLFPACPEINFIATQELANKKGFYNPIANYEDYFYREADAAAWLRDRSRLDKLNVLSLERFSCTESLARREVAQRLRALCPDARCLVVVRNQAEAVISAYAQNARLANMFLPTFEDYFSYNIREPRISAFRRYFYDEVVTDYERLFGFGSVLVLPFELLKLNATEFGAKLGAFAGISIPPDFNSIKKNERVSETYVLLRRSIQKIVSPEALRRIWLKTPFSYRRVIKSLALKGGRFDRQISAEQQELLRSFFGAGNDRLSQRHDLQLAERFGYLTHSAWQQSPAMQPDLMVMPETVSGH
jgi:hypothetical protein